MCESLGLQSQPGVPPGSLVGPLLLDEDEGACSSRTPTFKGVSLKTVFPISEREVIALVFCFVLFWVFGTSASRCGRVWFLQQRSVGCSPGGSWL